MSAPTISPYRSSAPDRHDGFPQLLHAEWTKFRTVRGWVIAMIVAILLPGLLGLLNHDDCSTGNSACTLPLGPGGEAVADSFYFVHKPLAGNGSITVRITSLTGQILNAPANGRVQAAAGSTQATSGTHPGLERWSKAGIIIKANTSQGSPYAAMMVTGSHGVRMQYNYTQDLPGLPGTVSAAAPRWLRLTRVGATITGYDSADGTHWTGVGTATLPGLPSTVPAGLFAASPGDVQVTSRSLGGGSNGSVGPSLATAAFDRIGLQGRWPGGAWSGENFGATATYPLLPGGYRPAGDGYAVTGSGDIAPDVPGGAPYNGISVSQTLTGAFAGLIVMIVVGTMFITIEYRRGLIRTTLTASPRRGRVLAAKAVVLAAVTFVAGLIASACALFFGQRAIRAGGAYVDPVSALTEVRVVAGMAALLAVAAVLALALGTILRRSAAAVAAVIVVIMLPYLLAVVPSVLPASVAAWLLRLTPAAGFAVERAYPVYHQVDATYSATSGYYPLVPWAGFVVLCGYAAVALGVAVFLLRRRDA